MRVILDFISIIDGSKTSVNVAKPQIKSTLDHWLKRGFYLHHITMINGIHEYCARLSNNKDDYIEYVIKTLTEFADPAPVRFLLTIEGFDKPVASTADKVEDSIKLLVTNGYSVIKINMLTCNKGLYEVNIGINHRNIYYLNVVVSNLLRSAELEVRHN